MDGRTSDIEQLEEENECGSDEEWTPKAVHTTEGSESSDEDMRGESVEETDAEVQMLVRKVQSKKKRTD